CTPAGERSNIMGRGVRSSRALPMGGSLEIGLSPSCLKVHDLAPAEDGDPDRGPSRRPAERPIDLLYRIRGLSHGDPIDREDDIATQSHGFIVDLERVVPRLQPDGCGGGVFHDALNQDPRSLWYI